MGDVNKMADDKFGKGLFPREDNPASANVVALREAGGTGVLPSQMLRQMIANKQIDSLDKITSDQIQPASLDLRLGKKAYRVRASFLPGRDGKVMDRVRQLDGLPEIDISNGAVLERGAVYVAEISENVRLPSEIEGAANPKSSTGRLDILTRLITDHASAFDRIEPGYKGPLYIEIAPLTFSVVVKSGDRLNQVRFHRGTPELSRKEVLEKYNAGELVGTSGERHPLRGALVPVTVDLEGKASDRIIGYKAKKNANKIDVSQIAKYDPSEFWDKIVYRDGLLNLDKDDFYILATREDVGIPPRYAAEMVAYDTGSGEFRVHYAGFFDPGFGWIDGQAKGSRGVLEVRSHGVPFILEHGQIVGWLRYSKIAGGEPDKIYGSGIRSNYQGQGIKLAKHFMPWPDE